MLIDEDYRETTTFLYEEVMDARGQSKRKPCGTVFFVSVEYASGQYDYYAVTARHIIRNTYGKGVIYARVALINGGYVDVPLPHSDWIQHPKTDIAATAILFPSDANVATIEISDLATDEFLKQWRVGEGDEVFFIGLFSEHFGTEKPLPIIRFGHISLMPYEPVPIKPDLVSESILVEAYLVEVRSWGGQSGSPTFIHFPIYRDPRVLMIPQLPLTRMPSWLLGLVSGHFDVSKNIELKKGKYGLVISTKGKQSILKKVKEGLAKSATSKHNTGIGVVIPAKYIQEVLDDTDFRERRKKLKNQIRDENG